MAPKIQTGQSDNRIAGVASPVSPLGATSGGGSLRSPLGHGVDGRDASATTDGASPVRSYGNPETTPDRPGTRHSTESTEHSIRSRVGSVKKRLSMLSIGGVGSALPGVGRKASKASLAE